MKDLELGIVAHGKMTACGFDEPWTTPRSACDKIIMLCSTTLHLPRSFLRPNLLSGRVGCHAINLLGRSNRNYSREETPRDRIGRVMALSFLVRAKLQGPDVWSHHSRMIQVKPSIWKKYLLSCSTRAIAALAFESVDLGPGNLGCLALGATSSCLLAT